MAAETDRQRLRADLESLRLDRPPPTAPRPRRRLPLALAVLLLVGLAVVAVGRLGLGQPPAVTVAEARQAMAAPALSGSGYVVTGERYVSIGARIPGRIETYLVEEGETVAAGDALVQLDDREYRAAVREAESRLATARANRDLAHAERTRGRRLHDEGVLSRQELDVLENRARVADASVGQQAAELDRARVNLEYTTLRAPSAGIVLAKLKEAGEIAVPGGFAGSGDLVRIANTTDMRVEVDVNEADLARVHLGQAAVVRPDAWPDARYEARVAKLYPQVDRQKGTLKVEVRILAPDARLLPDMSARVDFLAEAPVAGTSPAVLIPADALQRDGEGHEFVWVVTDERARRVPVEAGSPEGGLLGIVAGLEGGERVVTTPSRDLTDGTRVRLVD